LNYGRKKKVTNYNNQRTPIRIISVKKMKEGSGDVVEDIWYFVHM